MSRFFIINFTRILKQGFEYNKPLLNCQGVYKHLKCIIYHIFVSSEMAGDQSLATAFVLSFLPLIQLFAFTNIIY
jgi:hypothetical protein